MDTEPPQAGGSTGQEGMKSILFVIPHLGQGGAEKELVTLLGLLDGREWEVDLFLFEESGTLRDQIPGHVRVLPRDGLITVWNKPVLPSVLSLLKAWNWPLAAKRLAYGFQLRRSASPQESALLVYDYFRHLLPRLPRHYDVAMSCMEGMANYFVHEMTVADRKVASIHSDYEKMSHLNRGLDERCFEGMDAIVADSEGCREVLARSFPRFREKIHAVEPFVSPELVRSKALEAEDPFADGYTGIRIVTVARLSHPKGIDLAIKACRLLKDRGQPVRWYVLGDGEAFPALTKLVESLDLQQDFFLLGTQANPYPYIRACHIYVQPSRWEGWCISIEEAKILAKPILVTRFRIAESRVESGVTGMIVDLHEQALAQGIAKLVEEPRLRAQFSANLESMEFGYGGGLRKFNALIGTLA